MLKRPLSTCLCLLAMAAPLAAGCSHGPQPRLANVQPSSMPSGASWTGVYFNPLFGFLHVEEKHGQLEGRWMRPQKDRWGEFEGQMDEDVVHFSWTEYVTDGFGPNAKKQGKGYFHYVRPSGDNIDDVLEGEMGSGKDELGIPWRSVKQRNVDPDLDSVTPGARPDGNTDDWDGSGPKKEAPKAAPQEPKAPEPAEEPEAPAPAKGKGSAKTKGGAKAKGRP